MSARANAVAGALKSVGARTPRRTCVSRAVSLILAAGVLLAPVAKARAENVGHVAILHHDGSPYESSPTAPNSAPRERASREFFATHRDAYDFLIVFPAFPFDLTWSQGEIGGLHTGVRNDVRGTGQPLGPFSGDFGSGARLKAYIDINTLVPGHPQASLDQALFIVAHEVAHQWSGAARYRDAGGAVSDALLGQLGMHWSYFLSSQASVLYGSDWKAAGPGQFSATGSMRRYSDLDLYLVGLLSPAEVPPLTLVRPAAGTTAKAMDLPPPIGTMLAGAAETITIDQVIGANGPRLPAASASQRTFRAAFAILAGPGQTPTAEQITFVDGVRRQWANQFFFMTRGRAVMETELSELVQSNLAPNPMLQLAAAYLLRQQQPDGCWADDAATRARETQLALEAISFLGTQTEAAQARVRGRVCALAMQPGDADTTARRALAVLAAGTTPAPAPLAFNADGGIGLALGYGSTVVDTALVLMASGPSQPPTDPLAAADWLTRVQNGDGGWPFAPGGRSQVEATAWALRALSRMAQADPLVATSIEAGAVYLQAERMLDGLYGSDVPTVSSTAEALLALLDLGRIAAPQMSDSASRLLDLQGSDGNWEGSVHATALAFHVLARGFAPNLVVDPADMALSAVAVAEGDAVRLDVRVRNDGLGAAPGVLVRVVDDAGRSYAPDQSVFQIAGHGEAQVSFILDTTGHAGARQVFVLVDPEGVQSEIRRDDNRAAASLVVAPPSDGPDPMVVYGSVAALPAAIDRLPADATVAALLANAGREPVTVEVAVSLRGVLAAVRTVSLPALSRVPLAVALKVPPGAPGDVPVAVEVDPNHLTADARRDNNRATGIIRSISTVDLGLTSFLVTPAEIEAGGEVRVSATVGNRGTIDAVGATLVVTIADGGGRLVADVRRPLPVVAPGQLMSQEVVLKPQAVGQLVVAARAEHALERDPSDNFASAPLVVRPSAKPNLRAEPDGIAISPSPALEGSSATATARVANTGAVSAGPFAVEFRSGRAPDGPLLARHQVAGLPAGGNISLEATVPVQGRQDLVVVIRVDPDGAVSEIDETDNEAAATSTVVPLPDLVLDSGAIRLPPGIHSPRVPVAVAALVANRGGQAAGATSAELYAGLPGAGGLLIGTVAVPSIPSGDSAEVTITWTPAEAGPVRLVAQVNGLHTAVEGDYQNNRTELAVLVGGGPVSSTEPYFSPNGDGVKDASAVVYQLDAPAAASIELTNGSGHVVRTLTGTADAAVGSVPWDGRDTAGAVVRDGRYTAVVRAGGQVIGSTELVVDTNRSPLQDAGGTEFLEVGASTPNIDPTLWGRDGRAPLPDDRGLVTFGCTPGNLTDCGWWVHPVGAGLPTKVRPEAFYDTSFYPTNVAVSPDGSRFAYIGAKHGCYDWIHWYFVDDWGTPCSVVDVVDLATGQDRFVAQHEPDPGGHHVQITGKSIYTSLPVVWSPDGRQLLFSTRTCHYSGSTLLGPCTFQLESVDVDGGGRTVLRTGYTRAYLFSPDGFRIAYYAPDGTLRVMDRDGKGEILLVGGSPQFAWVPERAELAYEDPLGNLLAINVDDGTERTLYAPPPDGRRIGPVFSPFGDAVAMADRGENGYGLHATIQTGSPIGAPLKDFYKVTTSLDGLEWSPGGTYLLVNNRTEAARSLENMGISLTVARAPASAVATFRGTAADRNLDAWALRVGLVGGTPPLRLIARGATSVVRGVLADWAPDRDGIYEAVLTVLDRAGNRDERRARFAWGNSRAIGNVAISEEYFSPNGDGVKDATAVTYSVSAAVSAELRVERADGTAVRIIPRTHLAVGDYSVEWDGRGDDGFLVPDGEYRIRFDAYQLRVVVDTVKPKVSLARAGSGVEMIAPEVVWCNGEPYDGAPYNTLHPELYFSFTHQASDTNLEAWTLENVGEQASEVLSRGTAQVASVYSAPSVRARGRRYQLRAIDRAGNAAASDVVMPEERLHLIGLDPGLGFDLVCGVPGGSDFGLNFVDAMGRYRSAGPHLFGSRGVYDGVGPFPMNGGGDVQVDLAQGGLTIDVLDTVAEPIVYWAVLYRPLGSAAGFYADANVRSRRDHGVQWTPTYDLAGDYEIAVEAMDLTGRWFNTQSIQIKLAPGGTPPIPQPPYAKELLICSQRGAGSLLVGAASKVATSALARWAKDSIRSGSLSFTAEGQSLPAKVVSLTPAPPAKSRVVVAAGDLPGCRYWVQLEGELERGGVVNTGRWMSLCGSWVESISAQAQDAWLTIGAQFRDPIQTVAVYTANEKGQDTLEGYTGPFSSVAPPVHVALGTRPRCTGLPVSLVARLTTGREVATMRGRDNWREGADDVWDDGTPEPEFALCGEEPSAPLQFPCTNAQVTLARTESPICHANDPVYTATFVAKSDNGVATMEARIERTSGAVVRGLPIPVIAPGPSATAQASFDTRDLPEGEYRVVLLARDGAGFVARGETPLRVDRAPGIARIDEPSAGGRACATAPDPSGRRLLTVAGLVSDSTLEKYSVLFGKAGALVPVFTNQTASSSVTGSLAQVDVTGLPSGDYVVSVAAFDASGGSVCSTPVSFRLENGVRVGDAFLTTQVFSPDGDTILDDVGITFSLDADAIVTGLANPPGGTPRSFASEPMAGLGTLRWSGRFLDGELAADGEWEISLDARDLCGTPTHAGPLAVSIDTVAPLVRFDTPQDGSIAAAAIVVTGEISDAHLSAWHLDVGEGVAPAFFTTIATGTESRTGTIGTIPVAGAPAGDYTLRLVADDAAGHQTVRTIGVRVVPGHLVAALDLAPSAISPNGDGIQDSAIATVALLAPAEVVLRAADLAGVDLGLLTGPLLLPAGPTPVALDSVVLGALPDARYVVQMVASDGAVAEQVTRLLDVDRLPPKLRVVAPAQDSYLVRSGPVVLEVADPLLSAWAVTLRGPSGAEQVIGSGVESFAGTAGSLGSLADGIYRLRATARDQAGNSNQAEATFTVDSIRPVVGLSAPAADTILSGRTGPVQVLGRATDDHLASWTLWAERGPDRHQLASGTAAQPGGLLALWELALEPEGEVTLALEAVDRSGNRERASVRTVVDGTPPVASIGSPRDTSAKSLARVVGTVSDERLQGWTLELADGPPGAAYRFTQLATGASAIASGTLVEFGAPLRDGTYTLRLTARDTAGNETTDVAGFVIDTMLPAAPLGLVAERQGTSGALLTWQASSDPDVVGYQVLRSSGASAPTPSGTVVTEPRFTDGALADGTYRYAVLAIDLAGNRSGPSGEASLRIDNRPPSVSIGSPAAGATVSGLVRITGVASSTDDFREYRLSVGAGDAPTVFTPLGRGTAPVVNGLLGMWETAGLSDAVAYTLRLEAEDLSGNSAEARVQVLIDNNPPAAPLLLTATASGAGAVVTWRANAETDLLGYAVYRNGVPANATGAPDLANPRAWVLPPGTTSWTDANLPDGTFTYQVQAFDRALNPSELSNSLGVTLERRAPVARINSPAHLARLSGPVDVTAEVIDQDVVGVRLEAREGRGTTFALLADLAQPPWHAQLDPARFASRIIEVRAVARDRSGKQDAAPQSAFFFVSGTVVAPALAALVDGQAATLTWSDSNPPGTLAAVEVVRDGGGFLDPPVPTGAPTATSSASGSAPAKAFDQDGGTSWTSAAGAPQAWEVVLSRPEVVQYIEPYFTYGATVDALVRVKGVWIPLARGAAVSAGYFPISIDPPLQVEAVRLQFTATPSGRAGMTELTLATIGNVLAPPVVDAGLADGNYDYGLVAWDAFGGSADAMAWARVYAPVVDSFPPIVGTPIALLSGYGAEPGATVTAESGGAFAGVATADALGQFSVQAQLAEGANLVSVRATDATGNRSRPSQPVLVTREVAPAAALVLSLRGVEGSTVRLGLAATGDTASLSGVEVHRAGPGGDTVVARVAPGTVEVVDFAVPSGEYVYTAVGLSQSGFAGPRSGPVAVTVARLPPPAPGSLVVSVPSEPGALDLAWSYSGPQGAAFLVERSTAGGPFLEVLPPRVLSATSRRDLGLSAGTVYAYRVRAVDEAGNVGPPSNVASGSPLGAGPFGPPVITAPTVAGVPVQLEAARTMVAGVVEAPCRVELVQDGHPGGQGTANQLRLAAPVVATAQAINGVIAFSPGGNRAAYAVTTPSAAHELLVDDLVSGTNVASIAFGGLNIADASFSQDGAQLAVSACDQNWVCQLRVADLATGLTNPLVPPELGDSWGGVWSPDGRSVAYTALRGGTYVLAVTDVATRTERTFLSGVRMTPAWVGLNTIITAVEEPTAVRVVSVDTASRAVTTLHTAPFLAWSWAVSPAGGRVALIAGDNSQMRHLLLGWRGEATIDLGPATTVGPHAFSPDGARLAFVDAGALTIHEIRTGQEMSAAVPASLGWLPVLHWSPLGLRTLVPNEAIHDLSMSVGFEIPVNLDAGRNLIAAVAVDGTGLRTAPSEAIDVTSLAPPLPDLTVAAAVQPRIPTAGGAATAFVTVSNVGRVPSAASRLDMRLLPPSGLTRQLPSVAVRPLGIGESLVVPATLDLTGIQGEVQLMAEIATLEIGDADRSNDRTILSFLVAAGTSPVISVVLSAAAVEPDGRIAAKVTVANAGAPAAAQGRLTLFDAAGVMVAPFAPDEAFSPLGAGQVATFARSMPAAGIVAGDYVVVAELVENGVVVARASAVVSILTERAVGLSLAAERPNLVSGEDAVLRGDITNLSRNAALDGARYALTVTTPAGTPVYAAPPVDLPLIWLGLSASEITTVPSGLLAPGQYVARADVTLAGMRLAQASASFEVVGRPLLVATLDVTGASADGTPAGVPGGAPLQIGTNLENRGGAPSIGVSERLMVVSMDSAVPVITMDSPVGDMGPGAVASRSWTVPTAGLSRGVYGLALVVAHDGISEILATARFRVLDGQSPLLELVGPSPGVVVNGRVQVSVVARDDASGVAAVRAVMGGTEVALSRFDGSPLSGTWTGPVALAGEGLHELVVSAVDADGNDGRTRPAAGNPLTLQVVNDTVAPVLSVLGVVDGAITNAVVVPVMEATDLHLAATGAQLNGMPFLPGTPISVDDVYVLVAYASDAAGNLTTSVTRFVVDRTPPVVTFIGVSDGAVLAAAVTPAVVVTDRNLVTQTVLLDGQPFAEGLSVGAEGPHRLSVEARDTAGNTTSQSITFTIDTIPPEVVLAGFTDGEVAHRDVVPTYGATDANLVWATATLNGLPFVSGTPVHADGTYRLDVVALDAAGHRTERAATFTIATQLPVITVSPPDGSYWKASVTPTWTVAFADPAQAVATLGGVSWPAGGIVSVEGTHRLTVTATNLAGPATATTSFVIDTTRPNVVIDGVSEGQVLRGPVTPSVSATDLYLATTVSMLDGVAWAGGAISDEGPHSLVVTASDLAGNVTDRPVGFTIDITRPTISITGVADGDLVNTTVLPQVTVTDLHPASEQVTIDDVTWLPGQSVSGEGVHVLAVVARDAAGNKASASVHFELDLTPPAISVDVADGATFQGEVTPHFSAKDLHPGTTTATLDGQPFTSGTAVSAAGAHRLEVQARDLPGNLSVKAVNFSVVAHRYTVEKSLAARSARVLAFVLGSHFRGGEVGLREAFLRQALPAGTPITFVEDAQAFLAELRSGLHNVVVLLDAGQRASDDGKPGECHRHGSGRGHSDEEFQRLANDCDAVGDLAAADEECLWCTEQRDSTDEACGCRHARLDDLAEAELTEAVFRGTGLVLVKASANEWPRLREATGVHFQGVTHADWVQVSPSALGAATRLHVDDGIELRIDEAAGIATFVQEGDRGRHEGAVAGGLRHLGLGAVVTLGFDVSEALPIADASALLAGAVAFVTSETTLAPKGIVEVRIEVAHTGPAVTTQVTETVGPDLGVAGAFDGGLTVAANQVQWERSQADGQRDVFRYLLRLPTAAGNYLTMADVTAGVGAGALAFGPYPLSVLVTEGASELLTSARALATRLSPNGREGSARHTILRALEKVELNAGVTTADRERAIADLLDAAAAAKTIEGTNGFAMRLAIGRLLGFWESLP